MRERAAEECGTPSSQKKESIVYRTRSKFSLNETPLEDIEQAFQPPDITTDMYELDCEKDDDWINFLIDFTQPLERVINGDDDPENDPDFKLFEDEIPLPNPNKKLNDTSELNNTANSTLNETQEIVSFRNESSVVIIIF